MKPEKSTVTLDETGLVGAWLVTEGGQGALDFAKELIEGHVSEANAWERLRRFVGDAIAPGFAAQVGALAWHMAVNQPKAAAKLGAVESRVFFDDDGLQMASGRAAATYHAELLKNSGASLVVDLTAGIGADTMAFARAGMDVIAYEADVTRAIFLKANIESMGLGDRVRVIHGDSTAAPIPEGAVVFLDPPRRTHGSRWGNDEATDNLLQFAAGSGVAGVLAKLSPAVDRGIGDLFGGDLDFISIDGECKEGLLRLGSLKASDQSGIAAILLPSGERLTSTGGFSNVTLAVPDTARYLYEPDPAVIRADLVNALAEQTGMSLIDPGIAYLLADDPVSTPFATGYRILAAMPYHRKPLQAWLDEHDAGRLIVKKRGIPDDPEEVRKLFKLRGKREVILALTRQGKRIWAFLLSLE